MVSQKETQSLFAVHERLAQVPELAELRIKAFDQLQTYWQAFYQAIYYKHPDYIFLVAVLMTQNPENIKTNISGPVPLIFSPKPEHRQEIGMIDYREFNDHRAAIVSLEQGERNEDYLAVFLGLNEEQLKNLNRDLPQRLEYFTHINPDDKLIVACQQEVKDNPLWQEDKYLKFKPGTLAIALQDLGKEFFALERD